MPQDCCIVRLAAHSLHKQAVRQELTREGKRSVQGKRINRLSVWCGNRPKQGNAGESERQAREAEKHNRRWCRRKLVAASLSTILGPFVPSFPHSTLFSLPLSTHHSLPVTMFRLFNVPDLISFSLFFHVVSFCLHSLFHSPLAFPLGFATGTPCTLVCVLTLSPACGPDFHHQRRRRRS